MNTNTITKYYIGRNTKDMETQTVTIDDLENKAHELFEGFTLHTTIGGWKGSTEDSAILEVIGLEESEAMKIKEELEDHFNQESVMTVRQTAEVAF